MRRSAAAYDRAVTFVLGLAMMVLGSAAMAWPTGWLARVWPDVPRRVTTAPGQSALDQPWWPWVCLAAGVLAAVAALWWLSVHLPRRSVGFLLLPGSGRDGRLLLDPAGPASVAADVFAATPGIRSAHGRVLRERGTTIVAITAVAEPHADLADVAHAAETVTTDLRQVLGRDDVSARITLRVAARRHAIGRVS